MKLASAAAMSVMAIWATSSNAQAAYIITVDEVAVPTSAENFLGLDVIANGKGSLNLSGLELANENDYVHNSQIYSPSAFIEIGDPLFSTYVGASGPSTFGYNCGCSIGFANSTSGSAIGVSDAQSHLLGADLPEEVFVPRGYVSGADLGSSSFVSINESYADLGLVPGTYVYSWAGDTLTVNVRTPFTLPGLPPGLSPVPLPASAPMFSAALVALGAVGYGLKRKKAAATA